MPTNELFFFLETIVFFTRYWIVMFYVGFLILELFYLQIYLYYYIMTKEFNDGLTWSACKVCVKVIEQQFKGT